VLTIRDATDSGDPAGSPATTVEHRGVTASRG
jgi:hypothetical protein